LSRLDAGIVRSDRLPAVDSGPLLGAGAAVVRGDFDHLEDRCAVIEDDKP
jgi:hypothetical protein